MEALRTECKYVEFSKTLWNMRPEAFCFDFYKEHNFYPIILLVNNISTIFKFTPENVEDRIIIAPKFKIIIKISDI